MYLSGSALVRNRSGIYAQPFDIFKGVGMLRASGCLGVLVSKFFGFSVSKFLGVLVSKFLGFKISRRQNLKVSTIPCYQRNISCFLGDIDPISKIFKTIFDGFCLFDTHIFRYFQKNGFSTF